MKQVLRIPLAVLAVALTLAVSGCGRSLPTSPDVSLGHDTNAEPSVAVAPGPIDPELVPAPVPLPAPEEPAIAEDTDEFTFVEDPAAVSLPGSVHYLPSKIALVSPDGETNVASGRWSLQFHDGSLESTKLVSIAKASDGSMRVEFGPDGTSFDTPVDLTVSYAGTALDPSSSAYVKGMQPVFLYFDPALGKWVEVASVNDRDLKVLRVKLQHFSTYGVGGKAGW